MALLSAEEFKAAVRTRYRVPTQGAESADFVESLDGALGSQFSAFWQKLLLLESLLHDVPTGDPNAILGSFDGECDLLVEFWRQSMLALPRKTLEPHEPDFRKQVLETYGRPARPLTEAEIAQALDAGLPREHIGYWESLHQLQLIIEELARGPDPDLAMQFEEDIRMTISLWQRGILARPRAPLISNEVKN